MFIVMTRDFLTIAIMSRLGIRLSPLKGWMYRIGEYMQMTSVKQQYHHFYDSVVSSATHFMIQYQSSLLHIPLTTDR